MTGQSRRNDPCPAATPVVGSFDDGGPRDSRRPSGINDWLLFQNQVGSCVMRHPAGETLSSPGHVVLIAPRTAHDYGPPPGVKRWAVRWVVFAPPARWTDLLRWPTAVSGIAVVAPSPLARTRIGAHIDDAWRIAASLVTGREAMALNAVEAALLWCRSDMGSTPPGDPRVCAVAETVVAHLSRPISLSGAARQAGLSPAHFARCFRTTYNSSFAAWVEDRRIARAQELLRHGDQPVTEIAAAVGYLDPFHFSACFRRRCGVSPRQFRQRLLLRPLTNG